LTRKHRDEPLRVVITGASSGIGQATAELFARRGAQIYLAARNAEALEKVATRCKVAGGTATAVRTDVTEIDDVRVLANRAVADLGAIDVWVSNVGPGAIGRYQDTPMEAHDQVVRTNLIGHMNDAHAVLPIFRQQGEGTFVNMISLGGFAAAPYAVAYSASKFGLRGFTEALRAELAEHPHIHVCDVYPGFVDTPGLRHGANFVGRRISSPPPVLDPWRVAAAIVRLADHPRPTTSVGAAATLTRLPHALSPGLTTRALGRFMTAYFQRAEPVLTSAGNLFEPSPDAAVVDGGLRSPKKRAAAGIMTGSAAAAAGFAILKRHELSKGR
jgi:short-subunit dehydrogenase